MIIGGLCIVLGIILLIPGLWWARNKAKKDPAFRKNVNFTKVGWIYLLVMLSMLFGGLLMPYLAPNSYLGQLASARYGRLIWTIFIIFIFVAVQKVLNFFGVLIEKPENKDGRV